MTYILDGARMDSRISAHEEIASALELPSWYGANLDALADVLAGLHAVIRMKNTAAMLNALKLYGVSLLQVIYESPVDFIAE